jgi:tetratricopeptide (TPR) repeat protein
VRPFEECREPLNYAYLVGLESGDIEFALGCKLVSCFNSSEDLRLPQLASALDTLFKQMELCRQPAFSALTLSKRQLIYNVMGYSEGDPWILKGHIVDDTGLQKIQGIKIANRWNQTHLVLVNFMFGRMTQAVECAKDCRALATRLYGPLSGGFVVFICGLVDVVDARQRNKWRAPYAKKCCQRLRHAASTGYPLNFLGKYYLLEAELAALSGRKANAFRLFVTAISTSQQGNFMFLTALANERTARFLLEQNDAKGAMTYFQEALVRYRDWGGWAKVEHMENEIRSLGLVK